MEGGDVAGGTIDDDPGGGLPDPALAGVIGKAVVDVEGAADGEGAVGDVVELANGPLLLFAVDEERADFEGGAVVVLGVGRAEGGGEGDFADGAKGDGVDFRGFGRGREGVRGESGRE